MVKVTAEDLKTCKKKERNRKRELGQGNSFSNDQIKEPTMAS